MDPQADRAASFERLRRRLFGLAYRMLGSVNDAEDLVQEAYLRWHEADVAAVRSAEAWLLSVVSRLAIDRLRRLATERAAYVGPWLPEPIATDDPERAASLQTDASIAFLLLLDRLGPEERAAFLLREVFDRDYAEIGAALDKTEAACRQLVHRAKERVQTPRATSVSTTDRARLLERLSAAIRGRDSAALFGLLTEDVRFVSDGGGKVFASRRVLVGVERVARVLLAVERKWGYLDERRVALVNGEPALVTLRRGAVIAVSAIEITGDRVSALYRVLNPEKLKEIAAVLPSSSGTCMLPDHGG